MGEIRFIVHFRLSRASPLLIDDIYASVLPLWIEKNALAYC